MYNLKYDGGDGSLDMGVPTWFKNLIKRTLAELVVGLFLWVVVTLIYLLFGGHGPEWYQMVGLVMILDYAILAAAKLL